MNRRQALSTLPGLTLAGLAAPAHAIDLGRMLDLGADAAKMLSLTDEQVRDYARQMAEHSDRGNRIAAPDSPYGRRLAVITAGLEEDGGMRLNYKVYMSRQVNAFAMADGTIRFYSGLMDMMTDDELRYVTGHEIGHVVAGHTRKRMQTALAASGARKVVAMSGSRAATLAHSELGDLFEKVVRAQHSQGNEREADDYALDFLGRRNFERRAAVSALEKLVQLSGDREADWLSTHPSPRERAERMRQRV